MAKEAPVSQQPKAAPEQVQPPGVAPQTAPVLGARRYAIVKNDVIQRIVEQVGAPMPAEGERVVDVHSVPAFPGNVVDAIGNVSPASMQAPASAQAVAPEVTPATVPAAPMNAIPLPQNPATGG